MPPNEAWVIPPLMNTSRRVTIGADDAACDACEQASQQGVLEEGIL